MKLTAKQIEAARAKDRAYKLSDGAGMFLYVSVTGFKSWRLKYRIDNKEKLLTIGSYPSVSLSEARKLRDKAKDELLAGVDPASAKKETIEKNKNLFSEIFNEWFDYKKGVWSEIYQKELFSMFKKDILPIIGDRPISEIEPLEIVKIIRHFESRGAMERASKARRRCGEVFRYAIITGRAKYNPAPDLADAEKGYRKSHYPYLSESQIGEFNKSLDSFSGSVISKIATQVLQYTALRTKEMRSVLWTDVDFENGVIAIRPEVMKNRKPHVVPMSKQVRDLLIKIKPMTSEISEYVFAGRTDRKKPISNNAVLLVIRQIGYDGIASGHGFRHQFSTILYDSNLFESKWIEKQLAHVDKNSIRGVYNHAEYLEKRREMMQWFADYIDSLSVD